MSFAAGWCGTKPNYDYLGRIFWESLRPNNRKEKIIRLFNIKKTT